MAEHFLVIAYDTPSDQRRLRLAKVLADYGIRVNDSVFECRLTTAAVRKLREKLLAIVLSEDVVLFYGLCRHCEIKREVLGKQHHDGAARSLLIL